MPKMNLILHKKYIHIPFSIYKIRLDKKNICSMTKNAVLNK